MRSVDTLLDAAGLLAVGCLFAAARLPLESWVKANADAIAAAIVGAGVAGLFAGACLAAGWLAGCVVRLSRREGK